MVYKKQLRSFLPISSKHLEPSTLTDTSKLTEKRKKCKVQYDKTSKGRSDFKEGESVIIRKENCWVPGEIVEKCTSPRSYWVRDNFGKILRRNSSFLKHCPNEFPAIHTQDSLPEIMSLLCK